MERLAIVAAYEVKTSVVLSMAAVAPPYMVTIVVLIDGVPFDG